MMKIRTRGSFTNTEKFLRRNRADDVETILREWGEVGIRTLAASTPKDTGETARSWGCEIEKTKKGWSLVWTNSHIENGANIAILLQYGHGTGTGGYVQGVDYINPALRPIFETIADKAWKEVAKA